MELDEALQAANERLAELAQESADGVMIDAAQTIEEPKFWVFFANSKRYLESGDTFSQVIIPPLLVLKDDGTVRELPTQFPAEHYLDEYR